MANSTVVDLAKIAWTAVSAGQIPPPDVSKLLLSKMLGYGILAGAGYTKVPQIQNVLRAQSAEGLSALSAELETFGLIVHALYGFLLALPFNAYGEAVLLAAQSMLLLTLIYSYSKTSSLRSGAVIAVFACLFGAVFSGHLDKETIQTLFQVNNLVFIAARVPQIIKNFMAGSTGHLSFMTAFINFAGSAIRVFTSIQEGGPELVRQYIISVTLNLTLVLQILYYGWRASAATKARLKKLEKARKKSQ